MADLLSTRPPVTAHEAAALDLICDSITASATYHLEGKISEASLSGDPCLVYVTKTETGRAAGVLPLFTASQEDLEDLHKVCSPHRGQSEDQVIAEPYSAARELPASGFELNVDVVPAATVSSFCQRGVKARRFRLNSYEKGGSFAANEDGEAHFGTLIIGLPTSYEGGALVLRRGEQSTTLDWSKKGRDGDDSLLWTFFYSDVEHEILPITAGHCITLVYNIFATNHVIYRTPIELQTADVENTTLYTNFRRALRDAEFLPNGGRLAFGLAHEYSQDELKWDPFDAVVKGTDRILWQVLTEFGMDVELKAVYGEDVEIDWAEYDSEAAPGEEDDRYPVDAFSSGGGDNWPLMTSNSFDGNWGDRGVDNLWESLRDYASAEVEWDLIWVTRPEKYVHANSYTMQYYGDVCGVSVAGALLVEVPPAGEGCRTTTAP